ncbi:MAG: hypothetical protein ABJA98_25570 [Acidobacteriota bacterium]
MRTIANALLFGFTAVTLLTVTPEPVRAATPEQGVLRLEVVTGAITVEGTCVLVQQENRGTDAVLYFLASSRLFTSPDADPGTAPRRVRILRDRSTAIEVSPADIILPTDSESYVAVIRARAAAGTLVPLSPVFQLPQPGQVFIITGFGTGGSHLSVPERVRYGSPTALVVEGDREAGRLVGCAGAPAIVEGGVFGLVSTCPSGAAPSLALLSAARRFISDNVPGLESSSLSAPAFTLFTRSISRPLPSVRRNVQQNGDVEVPIELGPRELALDATASITDEHSLHLVDLPVLSVRDRSVKLRLTMVGTPLSPFATTAGPHPKDDHALGQALVTVRVDVLALPRQD